MKRYSSGHHYWHPFPFLHKIYNINKQKYTLLVAFPTLPLQTFSSWTFVGCLFPMADFSCLQRFLQVLRAGLVAGQFIAVHCVLWVFIMLEDPLALTHT